MLMPVADCMGTGLMALPLDWASASGEADFIVSDANAAAVRHLEHWSLWPVRASLLTGPPKSGRSHLGRIFQHWSSGDVIDDADLADEQMIFHEIGRATSELTSLMRNSYAVFCLK